MEWQIVAIYGLKKPYAIHKTTEITSNKMKRLRISIQLNHK